MADQTDLRDALMILLENRAVLRETDPSAYALIRNNFPQLQKLCAEELGLQLIRRQGFFRLEKNVLRFSNPIKSFALKYPQDFVYFVSVLAYVESIGVEQPFLLSELIEFLDAQLSGNIEWTQYRERLSLTRVLKGMETLNLLRQLDGDIVGLPYQQVEALLISTSYAGNFLSDRISNLSQIKDWHTLNDPRNEVTMAQQARQLLLLTVGISRTANNLELFEYMHEHQRSFSDFFEQYTVFEFELSRNVAMLTIPEPRRNLSMIPTNSSLDDLLMLIGYQLRIRALPADEYGQITITENVWFELVSHQLHEYGDMIAKQHRETSPDQLSQELLDRASNLRLLTRVESGIKILPLFGRLAGEFIHEE